VDTRHAHPTDIDAILNGLLGSIVDNAPTGIIVIDPQGCIRLVNIEIETLLGYRRDELLGQPVDRLVPTPTRARHPQLRATFHENPDARLMGRGRDVAALCKDGRQVTVEVSLRPLDSALGTMVVATLVDVSERRRLRELTLHAGAQLEDRVRERTAELEAALRSNESLLRDIEAQRFVLEQLSREDPLTGLSNRRDFERRFAEEILRAERLATPLCVAMLDIDHFKNVNDRFGHAVGDTVLQQVAGVIRGQIRAIDLLARYGGEEFALVMPATGPGEAKHLCERIRRAFHTFAWNTIHPGLSQPITISIGLGVWRHGLSAACVIDEADRNLYIAKREGRDRVVQPGEHAQLQAG